MNAQELLVERCLEDDQLLEALAPDPLLASDLLTLDDSTLKSELNDDIDISATETTSVEAQVVTNYINSLANSQTNKDLETENSFKMETRRNRQSELDPEEQLCELIRIHNTLSLLHRLYYPVLELSMFLKIFHNFKSKHTPFIFYKT